MKLRELEEKDAYRMLSWMHSKESKAIFAKDFINYTLEDIKAFISESLCEQTWAEKASVVFYYSCVFYRAEWRYGIWAHGPVLMDAGHVTENLYLASESIGLGGCAIAAVEPEPSNEAFGLDGEEESIFYAMPVGTVKDEDAGKEADFYAFLKEEGL